MKDDLINLEKLSASEVWEKASEQPVIKVAMPNDCGGGLNFLISFLVLILNKQ